jgi:uncharacterized protein (DUF433 family)
MDILQINMTGYFDFLDKDDIRVKGTRVGIETVLEDYLNGSSPEEISVRYPTLTLEQIYATITYYLRNRDEVDSYLERWRKYSEESWKRQSDNPSPAIKHLREFKMRRNVVVLHK